MPASPALIRKLNTLPMDRLAEVETFVDFVSQREKDHALVAAASAASAPAFAAVWDNPEDQIYDAL